MQDPEHEERTHGIVDDPAIGTIELGDSGECEAKRHVFEEVGVCSGVEMEVAVSLGVIAEILVFLDAIVDHAIGEVDEVGGERESPGASDCCNNVNEELFRDLGRNGDWGTDAASLGQGPPLQG